MKKAAEGKQSRSPLLDRCRWSSLMCQETNKALLKGIQISAEVSRGSCVHKPAPGDHADLVAQTADLMRVVATEKCRDVFFDCQAAEKAPHLALRGQVKTPYGFVEEQSNVTNSFQLCYESVNMSVSVAGH